MSNVDQRLTTARDDLEEAEEAARIQGSDAEDELGKRPELQERVAERRREVRQVKREAGAEEHDQEQRPYRLPQEQGGPSPAALDAALSEDVPAPARGLAGESEPEEPSRAEVLAMRPDLAADNGVSSSGAPTAPIPPEPRSPESGVTTAGTNDPEQLAESDRGS